MGSQLITAIAHLMEVHYLNESPYNF